MDLKVPPVIQLLIAMLLSILLSNIFTTFAISFPFKTLVISLLMISAFLLASLAITTFRRHQTTVNPMKPENSSIIVSSGVYAKTRNPMYLAMLLTLIAFIYSLENLSGLAAIILFIGYMNLFQIIPEEKALANQFGDEYQQYLNKVRRWL